VTLSVVGSNQLFSCNIRESAVLPSCHRPFFCISVRKIVCHDCRVVASEQDMKELTHQPPTLFPSGFKMLRRWWKEISHKVFCNSLPLCRQTDAVAGGLPSLVLKMGEVRQLTLSRKMNVFPRNQLLVRMQANMVCMPSSSHLYQ